MYKRDRNEVYIGKMKQNNSFLNNVLKSISNFLEAPRSDKEIFDGRGWDSFKEETDAYFELMKFEETEIIR